jgi:hypothetical protein
MSKDQSTLALAAKDSPSEPTRVTVTLVDADTAKTVSQGVLDLAALAPDTSVLVTPVFTDHPGQVALVLSISVPSNIENVTMTYPLTGQTITFQSATWTPHHVLAYYNRVTGSFTGPFDLADAPSLMLVSAAANANDLFLWTVEKVHGNPKRRGQPPPKTHLSVFPLGSGKARLSMAVPGPRPQGEPIVTLLTGDVVRLVSRRGHLQAYAARDGHVTDVYLPALDIPLAKIAAVNLQPHADGMLFAACAGAGRAVIVDPAHSFRTVSVIRFPPTAYPATPPLSKAVLSADGKTVYVVGPAGIGGVAAYDAATGALVVSRGHGKTYTGVYQLPSGMVLAISNSSPQLSFFTPALDPVAAAHTPLRVAAVF